MTQTVLCEDQTVSQLADDQPDEITLPPVLPTPQSHSALALSTAPGHVLGPQQDCDDPGGGDLASAADNLSLNTGTETGALDLAAQQLAAGLATAAQGSSGSSRDSHDEYMSPFWQIQKETKC